MSYKKIKIQGSLVFMDPVAKQQIRGAMDEKNVDLDMSGVEYMDSSGIELLYNLCLHLKRKNGRVRLRNVNSNIREMMEICSLEKVAEIVREE